MTEVNRDVRVSEGDFIAQINFRNNCYPFPFGGVDNRLAHAASRTNQCHANFVHVEGAYLKEQMRTVLRLPLN